MLFLCDLSCSTLCSPLLALSSLFYFLHSVFLFSTPCCLLTLLLIFSTRRLFLRSRFEHQCRYYCTVVSWHLGPCGRSSWRRLRANWLPHLSAEKRGASPNSLDPLSYSSFRYLPLCSLAIFIPPSFPAIQTHETRSALPRLLLDFALWSVPAAAVDALGHYLERMVTVQVFITASLISTPTSLHHHHYRDPR
jgi:hypothetical protein